MIRKSFAIAVFAVTLTGACAPEIKTSVVSGEMAPAEARIEQIGDTWVYNNLISGAAETSRITAIDGKLISGVNETTGCSFTYVHAAYAPSVRWDNCNGSSGNQSAERNGSIFPIQLGNAESWKFSGQNAKGETWESVRNCSVVETAKVTVPAGTFDTYHIKCEDEWWVRHYYYAPEVGSSAIRLDTHKTRNEVRHRELVSFTPGQA